VKPLALGHLSVTAVVQRAGPTRPTWLLPDPTPEAVDRHRAWLWLEPTPGHTPGHMNVRLRAATARMSSIQVAEPDWSSHFDTDAAHARATRRAFCARYADTPVTVLGTHLHYPTAGRIVTRDTGWRFQVDTP
jgi:hypothetical protein